MIFWFLALLIGTLVGMDADAGTARKAEGGEVGQVFGCLPGSPLQKGATRYTMTPSEISRWTRSDLGSVSGDSVSAAANGDLVVDVGTADGTGIQYQLLSAPYTPQDGDVAEFEFRFKVDDNDGGTIFFGLIDEDTTILDPVGANKTFQNGIYNSSYDGTGGGNDSDWGGVIGGSILLKVHGDVIGDGFARLGVRVSATDVSDSTTHYGEWYVNGERLGGSFQDAVFPTATLYPSVVMLRSNSAPGDSIYTLSDVCVATGQGTFASTDASGSRPRYEGAQLGTFYPEERCVIVDSPVDASDRYIRFTAAADTEIVRAWCLAEGGGSIGGVNVQSCGVSGGSCSSLFGADFTCSDVISASAQLIPPTPVTAARWLRLIMGVPSGTVDTLTVCVHSQELLDTQ